MALDQGEEWLSAQIYHDLELLYFELGDLERAQSYIERALAIYPKHHERYPIAAHDFVFLFVVRGHFAEALPLLEGLFQAGLPPRDQLLVAGSYARAAGGANQVERYALAEGRILHLAPHHDLHAGAAYVNLAIGALSMGDWELAEAYATKGIVIGEAKNQKMVASVGRQVLADARVRRKPVLEAPPLDRDAAHRLQGVATSLRQQLLSWRSETWTKKEDQFGIATLASSRSLACQP